MPARSMTRRDGRLAAAAKATTSRKPTRPNPSARAARAASVA